MNTQDFATSFITDKSPEQVFNAINNVHGWWSGEIEGDTNELDAEFTYTVPGIHFSKQIITELIPGKKIVWLVVDAMLSFVSNKSEWKGTSINFDIVQKGDKTELLFTHVGLDAQQECYKDCSNAWGLLIHGNLKNLIITGEDQPSPW